MKALRYLTFIISINYVSSDFRWKRDLDCFEETNKCTNNFECTHRMTTVLHTLCGSSLGYSIQESTFTKAAAKKCPRKCAEELHKFTTTGRGRYLVDCNCPNRDSTCLTMKSRIKKCIASGLGWPMNDTKPSCSEARLNCTNNPDCNRAMGHFLRQCSRLISGVECNEDCRKAQNGFLELSIGKLLENECECDGVEETFCRGIRAHYQALCLPTRVTKSVSQKLNTTEAEGSQRNLANSSNGSFWNLSLCFLAVTRFL